MDETPATVEKRERMKLGPILSIIILILIFAVGGAYFFMREQARLHAPPVQETFNV